MKKLVPCVLVPFLAAPPASLFTKFNRGSFAPNRERESREGISSVRCWTRIGPNVSIIALSSVPEKVSGVDVCFSRYAAKRSRPGVKASEEGKQKKTLSYQREARCDNVRCCSTFTSIIPFSPVICSITGNTLSSSILWWEFKISSQLLQ